MAFEVEPDTVNTILIVALPVFALSMLLEWKLSKDHHDHDEAPNHQGESRRNHHRGYGFKDTLASLTMGTGYLAIMLPFKGLTVAAYLWLYQNRIFDFEFTALHWVLLLFAEDFCFYWYHRLHHTVRILWAVHINHHSSKHYNLSTALRQPWTSPVSGPIFWAILPLLGFPVEFVLIQQFLNLLYQYWIHTELIGSMGWFGLVFNTPSHHRVHHGKNLDYLDKNYGGIFIIWDRMFGTFAAEDEPVEFGLTTDIESYNPIVIAFHEFHAAFRDLKSAESWRARWFYLFGEPGWREDGQHFSVRTLQSVTPVSRAVQLSSTGSAEDTESIPLPEGAPNVQMSASSELTC